MASQRGAEGGYWLARPAEAVSVADIIRAVEGPLADVHGTPPEEIDYVGPARPLQRVWIATRAALRSVLEEVTLADIVAGRFLALRSRTSWLIPGCGPAGAHGRGHWGDTGRG